LRKGDLECPYLATRKPYREGQEDQLGALGFALNALVVWNAQYIDDAIAYLRWSSCSTPFAPIPLLHAIRARRLIGKRGIFRFVG
jgi:hypothetical protein